MTPTEQITQYIAAQPGWKGKLLTQLRVLIHEVDSEIVEEWKWETPVFTHIGMVCALGVFADHVKINFFQGAALNDSLGLFNAGLEAKKMRAIDLYENDTIDEEALNQLLRDAVAHNTAKK